MKFYYYIENDEKKGPFTLLEKDEVRLSRETLVWEESFENWKKAEEVEELKAFISIPPPPIPKNTNQNETKIGYGSVEDVAGVNYRNAIVFTGAFIAITVFYNSFFYSFFGFFVWFILPIIIWKYFKTFFESMGDHKTGKFIRNIMVSYAVYFFSYLIFKIMVGTDMINDSMIELIIVSISSIIDPNINPGMEDTKTFLVFSTLSLIALFVSLGIVVNSGYQIMKADKNYDFPLKRIALASMICIPLTFFSYLGSEDEIGLFGRLIHLIPYILLFFHFYNAETLDKNR